MIFSPLQVVQRGEVKLILDTIHESAIGGHMGEKATIDRQRGQPITYEPLHPIKLAQLFDHIEIDFVRPLPQTKQENKYLIVATEFFTKWPEVERKFNNIERRLENIKILVQKLVATLEPDELVLLDQDRVTLRTNNQEVSDNVVIPKRRTLAERIHKNMSIYMQDLDHGDPQEPILPFEIPAENWDENVMAERECGEIANRKLRTYFQLEKGKLLQKCQEEYINSLLHEGNVIKGSTRPKKDGNGSYTILNDLQELVPPREG
ncbi:hypothetical protein C2G38_2154362 [Gigaspora rosea]|uniref:Integrase zinc-binding domain-containing protein n=1 Tax=Gigaspora rosea TaxID=44941 RepID=A0A397W536_9GLOM|nr:hypothetical protein C2G38_2154362 [Gigaspora rosea]